MKRHTVFEYVKLWFSNWKYRRLLKPQWARDPFDRNIGWLDLPFVAFGIWGMVISALWKKEKIPGTVMLVGVSWTMKEWDIACEWAMKLIQEHPEWDI